MVFLYQKPIFKEKDMSQILFIILFVVLSLTIPETVSAQSSDVAQKTQDLVAALGKTKYKKKEKKNFAVEVYIDIKNEAVVKNNVRDYAGRYVSEDGSYQIELRVTDNSRIEGSGFDTRFDSDKRHNFTLRDARIEGALLLATKVYDGGQTEKLEAVFINRTVLQGKNPNQIENRETKYGLGFVQINGTWTSRVFCEFKP
jgi:hypothetical protein